jgi:hypothetical protein
MAATSRSFAAADDPASFRPYGADRLGNTDASQMTQSLWEQIKRARLPLPYNGHYSFLEEQLFPDTQEHTQGLTSSKSIKGISPEFLNERELPAFKKAFENENSSLGPFPCQSLALGEEPSAYRAFAALHETSHYIAAHLLASDKSDLNDLLFNSLFGSNGNRYQTVMADHKAFLRAAKNHRMPQKERLRFESVFIRDFVASDQAPERLGDASAVLYALSNFGDTQDTLRFIEKVKGLRDAEAPFGIGYIHDTGSSIDAAIGAFRKSPRQGLTLDQTSVWAVKIISQQPDLRLPLEEQVRDFSSRYRNLREIMNQSYAGKRKLPLRKPGSPSEERNAIDRARTQAVCAVPRP